VTLSELLVSAGITMTVTGALFSMVDPVHGLVQAQPEAGDIQQRTRVAVAALTRSILAARIVVPRRVGRIAPDPQGAFRPGTVALISDAGSDTYYLERNAGGGSLKHYDGDETDLPVVDHVVALGFQFFGIADPMSPVALDPAVAAAGNVTIARVRVFLRVQAAPASLRGRAGPLFLVAGTSTSSQRFLPDRSIEFDVAPRNH
jgi:hypothetical protein